MAVLVVDQHHQPLMPCSEKRHDSCSLDDEQWCIGERLLSFGSQIAPAPRARCRKSP